jgi:hypothetical protein
MDGLGIARHVNGHVEVISLLQCTRRHRRACSTDCLNAHTFPATGAMQAMPTQGVGPGYHRTCGSAKRDCARTQYQNGAVPHLGVQRAVRALRQILVQRSLNCVVPVPDRHGAIPLVKLPVHAHVSYNTILRSSGRQSQLGWVMLVRSCPPATVQLVQPGAECATWRDQSAAAPAACVD